MTGRAPAAAFALALFVMMPAVARAAQGLTAWPQFGGSPAHNSYNPDPAMTVGSAPGSGVDWMANLYSADLGSAVVGVNAVLGKTVAYVGNERGDVFAVNTANGALLWSTNLGVGDAIRSTPAIAPDGTVWVGTVYNPTLYKLDGATGAITCSVKTGQYIDGSVMITTPAGGSELVYVTTNNNHTGPGPLYAINERTCATVWTFTDYVTTAASSWTTPAFGVGSNGRSEIVIGSTDPDSRGYGIDALTGARIWDFFPIVGPGAWDMGATADISPPGTNGFTDGVAYMQSKYGIEYALDLVSGAQLWSYPMSFNSGARDARSAAARDGNALVFGYQDGVDALNATTGSLLWQYTTPLEVVSGPVVAGPAGSEVVGFGDISGAFRLLSLASGMQLYRYQTNGYITSSPAELNGEFYSTSSDGFLYAYKPGGSNAPPPASTITYPANLSTIPNPNGNLTITGTSTDNIGVVAVEIAIQSNGSSGPWYNAATNTWVSAPIRNPAVLTNPGRGSTNWSFALPAPPGGGVYEAFANTVNVGHIVDRGTITSFSISASENEPTLTLSTAFVAPGSSFTLTGQAFAAGESVAITFLGNVVATVEAASNGDIPQTPISVPTTAPFGPTSVTATGKTSGKTASATVGITNNWTQSGFGSTKTSFEPHDTALTQILDIGQGTVLRESWEYQTSGAVNSSPAVVDGVVYAGNDMGELTAIIASTGAPQWTVPIPSKAAIRTAPAVDPAGNIIVGANDGNVYLFTSAGILSKTVALSGVPTSAAPANGHVYLASGNGTVYDFADSLATVVWSKSLPATTHSAPSVDTAANLLIIGDDGGNVTALNAATGAQVWQIHTGGAVTAQAAIQSGTVWIGSGDGTLYVLRETTGAVIWKAAADSAIVAGASVNGIGTVTFGTANGTLYQYTPTGQQVFAQPTVYGNTAIVGVSSITNNFFVETAGGIVAATRLDAGAPQFPFFEFSAGSPLMTAPTILDSAVYIAAGNGKLYAFTPYGKNPVPAAVHRAGPVITVTDGQWSCTPQ